MAAQEISTKINEIAPSGKWRDVSPEQASQYIHYGLGGWLLLIYLTSLIGVVGELLILLSPKTEPGNSGTEFLDIAYGEHGYAIAYAHNLIWLPFLLLVPLKHPRAPQVAIAIIWLGALPLLLSMIIILFNYKENPDINTFLLLVLLVVFIAIFVIYNLYFLHSKRVNATFLHRIPMTSTKSDFPEPTILQTRRSWRIALPVILSLAYAGLTIYALP